MAVAQVTAVASVQSLAQGLPHPVVTPKEYSNKGKIHDD